MLSFCQRCLFVFNTLILTLNASSIDKENNLQSFITGVASGDMQLVRPRVMAVWMEIWHWGSQMF